MLIIERMCVEKSTVAIVDSKRSETSILASHILRDILRLLQNFLCILSLVSNQITRTDLTFLAYTPLLFICILNHFSWMENNRVSTVVDEFWPHNCAAELCCRSR